MADKWPGRRRLHNWLNERCPGWLDPTLCKLLGHLAVSDHCGKPEHDYCVYCMRPMPMEATK